MNVKVHIMVIITVVSVSTPAVRETVRYARKYKDDKRSTIGFHIYYLCGRMDSERVDIKRMKEDITSSDFQVLDLMGADGDIVSSITDSLVSCKAQRVVIGRLGPVSHRLGGYDEKRFKADPKDGKNIELFTDYWKDGKPDDISSAFNLILKNYYGMEWLPDPFPRSGSDGVFLENPFTGKIFYTREEYFEECPRDKNKPNVILFFNSHNYPNETLPAVGRMYEKMSTFANILPVAFNKYKAGDLSDLRKLIGDAPDLAIDVVPFRFIAGPMGGSSIEAMKLLREMNVPFLRPFFISKTTEDEWKKNIAGLNVMEFMLYVFMAELDGGICTFPIGANEEIETIEEYGLVLSEINIIDDRLDRLCQKIEGMLRLKKISNGEKKIAIVGYNYPPGEGNLFGGSFLDTFGSMSVILSEFKKNGYITDEVPSKNLIAEFTENGLFNKSDWIQPNKKALIRYTKYNKHPDSMTEKWGPVPGNVLADNHGYKIPGVIHGNIFIGIQPPRGVGTGEDISKAYHDPYTPPHHQYLAFYEWIRDEFKADAVVHIGTHGTVEFLPGKEVAMSGDCFPDIAIGGIPHYYLYYMGNPSEAMIAKRRIHGSLISYMSPPYIRSDLYGELSELESLISEYRESLKVDVGRSENVHDTIITKAEKMRLPTEMDDLEHELVDMRSSLIPKGFHIYGIPFTKDEAESFAIQGMRFPHEGTVPLESILREHRDSDDTADEAERMYRDYNADGTIPNEFKDDGSVLSSLEYEKKTMERATGCDEIRGLMNALDGGFTDVKPGGDFLRSPEIVPTGYNIVQFDPMKVPSVTAFERGSQAAENTIEMYYREHGEYPKSVAMVMWGLEVSRSQGASVGQILDYLGFRMADTGGSFKDRFEIIPIEELGRPRIDVTVSICGFFRDMFSNLVTGLNTLFKELDELNEPDGDSFFAGNTRRNYQKLLNDGYSEEDARDLSRCRLFGPGEGLYGTGMTDVVNTSSWDKEDDLANVFEESMRHAYSLKFRGRDVKGLMSVNHKNVDIVSQIRDNIEHELIDLDHYYEFFGGLSKAVELSRGSKAAMYITDNTGPRLKTQDVKTSIEHGIRTRLLNPKWIDGMLETEYHGAQAINDRFENVLGLAATTGAVDSSVFSDMEKCYIADKKMRARLRENNNWALMNMIERLNESYKRKYWNATEEELETLKEAYLECEDQAESDSDI